MASTPCANCGTPVQAGAAFCTGCGAPTSPAPAPPPPQPVHQPAADDRPPASERNTVAGVIALVGAVVVVVGTFLPLVEVDLGGLLNIHESFNGWESGLNDGPIHGVVVLVPLIMGILALMNRARRLVKILLIVSALIGYFWVVIRFADIAGSLDEGAARSLGDLGDPGVGLYAITVGWTLVLVAGLVATAKRPGGAGRGKHSAPTTF